MILIAVVAVALTYSWAVGYAGQPKAGQYVVGERIKIEAARMEVHSLEVEVLAFVRNMGGSHVNLTDACLMAPDVTVLAWSRGYSADCGIYVDGYRAAERLLSPGEVHEVTIHFRGVSAVPGRVYVVKLATSMDAEAVATLKALPS